MHLAPVNYALSAFFFAFYPDSVINRQTVVICFFTRVFFILSDDDFSTRQILTISGCWPTWLSKAISKSCGRLFAYLKLQCHTLKWNLGSLKKDDLGLFQLGGFWGLYALNRLFYSVCLDSGCFIHSAHSSLLGCSSCHSCSCYSAMHVDARWTALNVYCLLSGPLTRTCMPDTLGQAAVSMQLLHPNKMEWAECTHSGLQTL